MLPTSFGKAVLVTLSYILVSVLVAVVFYGIFIAFTLASQG
jgi:hypothetical protein